MRCEFNLFLGGYLVNMNYLQVIQSFEFVALSAQYSVHIHF